MEKLHHSPISDGGIGALEIGQSLLPPLKMPYRKPRYTSSPNTERLRVITHAFVLFQYLASSMINDQLVKLSVYKHTAALNAA